MTATLLLPTLYVFTMKTLALSICLILMIGAALAESSDRKSRQALPIVMKDDGSILMDVEDIRDPIAWNGDVVAIPTILAPTDPAVVLGGITDQKTEEVRMQYGGGSYSRPLGGLYYGRPYGGGYYGRPNSIGHPYGGFSRPYSGFSRPYGFGRQYTPNFGGYSQFGGLSNAGGVSNGQGNGNSGGGTVNYAGANGYGVGGGYPGGIGGGYNAGLGGGYSGGYGSAYSAVLGSGYNTGLGGGFVPGGGSGIGNGYALRPNYNFGK